MVPMLYYESISDKKENQNFLIYKEIHNEAVAKSYMTNGLLILYMVKYLRISSYTKKPLLVYDFVTAPLWISLYMRKIWFPFFNQCTLTLKYRCVPNEMRPLIFLTITWLQEIKTADQWETTLLKFLIIQQNKFFDSL